MEIPSFKKKLLLAFSGLQLSKKEVLILVTPSGIISGKPLLKSDSESLPNYAEFILKTRNEYRKEYGLSTDTAFTENDGIIILKDALIRNSSVPFKLPYAVIFIDQVVGVSIGPYSN
jgi:hypothetical protein